MADNYVIRVTAGSTYDIGEQIEVPVNMATPVKLSTDLIEAELNVRVRNYRGLPHGTPATSPYFETEPHRSNGDKYSIAFRFRLKGTPAAVDGGRKTDTEEEEEDEDEEIIGGVSAADLQWGNDFDHPIRDRLPPGFSTAMSIVKWWIDPGLEGDAYADSPYLYGPALSSFNAVHVGPGLHDEASGGLWFEEGGDVDWRRSRVTDFRGTPCPDAAKARMAWALRPEAKRAWVWEYGRTYGVDFFNGYLDFDRLALRLPGYNLPIMKYWDGQSLRYVLRNRSTAQVYLVVVFSIYRKEEINEDGTLKPEALEASRVRRPVDKKDATATGADNDDDHEKFDEKKALDEARRRLSRVDLAGTPERDDGNINTSADDVD